MNTRIVAGTLALTLASGLFAQTQKDIRDYDVPEFKSIDKDGNGSISREEAKAFPDLEKIFSQVDADANGVLRESEYRSAVRKLRS